MKPLPNLSIIAAMSDNGIIGRDNRLPWHMPADLAHFKRITMGKPIMMGRRTWESLPGLLPHRTHIVVTRNRDYEVAGGHVVHSIEDALEQFGDAGELLVVGGETLYRQTLPLASRMYLTLVHAHIDGDARFPGYEHDEWCETAREERAADDRNAHACSFVTLQRC